MRPPVGAGAQARFFQHRKVGDAELCCDTRDVLGVDDHAQTDADAIVERLGIGQAQIDAAVATAPLIGVGIVEALVVLPGSVVEANHVALKRHPVAHRALVFGLTGLGVLGADKLGGAVIAVDLPHALGGGVFARFAGNKVGLPNDISALVIVARVLLGQVDVDIRLPIGLALGGKGVGLLGVIDLNLAGLLVVNSILDLLGKRAAVDGPTKVTAFDGAPLAIGEWSPRC